MEFLNRRPVIQPVNLILLLLDLLLRRLLLLLLLILLLLCLRLIYHLLPHRRALITCGTWRLLIGG